MVAPLPQPRPRFLLGRIVATPGAIGAMQRSGEGPALFLARHARGDWGAVDDEDKAANEGAVIQGMRIVSAYQTAAGEKLWVITEADRSVTTLLLPEEY